MTYGVHSAGRDVAGRVHQHFARYIAEELSPAGVQGRIPVPDVAAIEHLVEAAFWTSLRREEGYVPKISLALLPPEATPRPLLFEHVIPLHPTALAKVAPAVERAGIHLGVWNWADGLAVWGTTRVLPKYTLVLEVSAPGLLVIKQQRGGDQKFTNVAVIEGEQVKVVDERASSLPDCPSLLTSLLGFDAPGLWSESVNVLVQMAVSMRAHGRGGLLLVVSSGTEEWRQSIVTPIMYGLRPPFTELADLMAPTDADRDHRSWNESLGRAVAAVAGLTAVDGATLINDRYELLAFGAKIARRRGAAPVEQVTVTEPIEGGSALVLGPSELGGTRHLSAAQFVHDQRDAVALVASQDGRFTIFAWSPCEEMVHAHRVEALLL